MCEGVVCEGVMCEGVVCEGVWCACVCESVVTMYYSVPDQC